MEERATPADDPAAAAGLGRARVRITPASLTIEAPGPRGRGIPLPAVLFGVPWVLAVSVLSVWYLGWGVVPESAWVRILLWVVALALTHNLGTLAYITIWNAFYERIGIETLTIDPEYIVVVRAAGRFKREHRIGRKIIETAEVLPAQARRPGRPRVEIRSWRAAIGFGAGLDEDEARECARVVQARFDTDEAARHVADLARGTRHGDAVSVQAAPDTPGRHDETGHARTNVMRAYREALEARGSLRSRLGAIASVARRTGGRS